MSTCYNGMYTCINLCAPRDHVQEAQPQDNTDIFAELKQTEDRLAAIAGEEKRNRKISIDYLKIQSICPI